MSTTHEKLTSIYHSVEVTKRRLKELRTKRAITLSETYEMDMCMDTIKRGESLLKANKFVAPRAKESE